MEYYCNFIIMNIMLLNLGILRYGQPFTRTVNNKFIVNDTLGLFVNVLYILMIDH